ncbi:MAG: type II secretion system F family protein [Planctomycetales bacterium]|nr:type II secretion system F family protein [Planctomycetales bacterium]
MAWIAMEWLAARKPRVEQRLDEFREPRQRRQPGQPLGDPSGRGSSGVTKVLAKATPAFAKPLQSKDEKETNRLKLRLSQAGFRGDSASTIFLGMKLILLLVGLAMGGGVMAIIYGFNTTMLFRTVICGGIGFYIPEIVLWWFGKSRKEQIFLGLPDALDLMVVCVEAGLGLDQAMRKVAEEMKKSYPVLAEEFGLCNFQMQVGRTRASVLQELGERTGVDDLRSLASILIQADKFGSSIGNALRVQSDAMRTRRRQIAEEKAAKTAVKLIFPLVIFIFPGIFVVLVGPAAITMVREMFPAMRGEG